VDVSRVDSEGTKLYVGNLDFKTNEDDMRECFSKYGKIMDVYIPRERPDMKSRGFAFVTFNNKRDAEDAVDEMHDKDFDGRPLKVNLAKPRPAQSSGYGGGRDSYDRGRDSYGGGGGGGSYGRSGGGSDDMCRDYSRGQCDRGSSCRYAHERSSGRDDRRSRSRTPPRRNRSRSRSPPRRRSRSPRGRY